MTDILLAAVLLSVAVNIAVTLWSYRQIIQWIDAVAEMVGEAIDLYQKEME